jgi:hypothetical protein
VRASYTEFRQRLSELRSYIRGLESSARLLSLDSGSIEPSYLDLSLRAVQAAMPSLAARRRIEYTSSIISLYGAVEQFIEQMLRGLARHVNSVYERYSSIPDNVRSHHLLMSAHLLTRLDDGRYKNIITPLQVVQSLERCLADAPGYSLNEFAFSHHSANYRIDTIESAFANLGCQSLSTRLRACSPFADHLMKLFPEDNIAQKRPTEIFAIVSDLAERRNAVAHGMVLQTLSSEIIVSYIEYFEALSAALFAVVKDEATQMVADQVGIRLGVPIAVHDNRIVCFTLDGVPVRSGDVLIARTGDRPIVNVSAVIEEIQVNHVTVEAVEVGPPQHVALRIGERVKDNHEFFIVPRSHRCVEACL